MIEDLFLSWRFLVAARIVAAGGLGLVAQAGAQVMTGPNKVKKTLQGVTFDAAYDNGSIENVVSAAGANIFNCTLFTDTGEIGTAKYWFRFRLSGVASRTIRLNLDHVENPRPFIRVGDSSWRRTTATEAPSSSLLTFTFSAAQHEAEVAFFDPLGLSETQREVRTRLERSGFAAQTTIGTSNDGRAVEMVTVEDGFYPSAGKHRVWLHSRAHAGEVTATHSMLGFLDQVLDNSETGRRLREHCLFTIVPMLNPDGIARGHTRWDGLGIDPERDWCDIRIPEVKAIKSQVDHFMTGSNPIQVALNLHSTKGSYADSFFFKHLAPSVSPAFEAIEQHYIDAVNAATPLFSNASPQTSQLNACLFIESYFWNNWGASVMALTHEGHFYRRITDNEWITGDDYREIGRGLARALTSYFPLPPASEPDLTYAKWVMQSFAPADQANPAVAGEAADPDRDGVSNLLEYATGRHPLIADAGPGALRLDRLAGGGADLLVVTAEYSAYPIDLEIFVEGSSDLSDWIKQPDAGTGPAPDGSTRTSFFGRRADGHATGTISMSLPISSVPGRMFFRLGARRTGP